MITIMSIRLACQSSATHWGHSIELSAPQFRIGKPIWGQIGVLARPMLFSDLIEAVWLAGVQECRDNSGNGASFCFSRDATAFMRSPARLRSWRSNGPGGGGESGRGRSERFSPRPAPNPGDNPNPKPNRSDPSRANLIAAHVQFLPPSSPRNSKLAPTWRG